VSFKGEKQEGNFKIVFSGSASMGQSSAIHKAGKQDNQLVGAAFQKADIHKSDCKLIKATARKCRRFDSDELKKNTKKTTYRLPKRITVENAET